MHIKFSLFLASSFFLAQPAALSAQEQDSLSQVQALAPAQVQAYFAEQPVLGLTASAQTLAARQLEAQQTSTLLPAMNTVPGIRMEERSPGSYRLAMRGSLIRSPFGIRNTKIYIDELPFTDAGGNTYLNLLDPAGIAGIHILKGPDGSLYGANSGGVLTIQPKGFGSDASNGASLLLSGGSYGLFQEQLSLQQQVTENYNFSFDQSFTRSDGYRANTALNKKTFQTAHRWQYNPKNELRFFVLYSDMGYRTPGGLTAEQLAENPRMARPAAGPNPGAEEQKAGIYNKTIFGGITHRAQLTDKLQHVVSLFGSHTDLENPFISNYECRDERNLGLRTYFSYVDQDRAELQWQMQLGFEGQKGWYQIDNYDNLQGVSGDVQSKDKLDNGQYSFFYRAMLKLYERWTIEGSLGLNQSSLGYRQRYPEVAQPKGSLNFGSIWMPRIASSYLLSDGLAIRASISKGYSAPTVAEVRSSDQRINTELQAETGTNYELGARFESPNRRFMADLSLYQYHMANGIVQRRQEDGSEYYVNAGEMKQKGIEASVWAQLLRLDRGRFVHALDLHSAVAYNHYRFGKYQVGDQDFSGHAMTAVPDWVWSNTLAMRFPKAFALNVSHRFTSAMPLNDASTAFADKFHLLQLKGTWNWLLSTSKQVQFFAGVDNLLNTAYSLGNDINAFGDRFYNPAPGRNYYGGLKVVL